MLTQLLTPHINHVYFLAKVTGYLAFMAPSVELTVVELWFVSGDMIVDSGSLLPPPTGVTHTVVNKKCSNRTRET